MTGRPAIKTMWIEAMKGFRGIMFEAWPGSIEVDGDRATMRSYTSEIYDRDGTTMRDRGVECLRWAAIGKTDLEISMIMSRSRATVRFHIHNAAIKLNAVNRSQTVFKAAQLGYISL